MKKIIILVVVLVLIAVSIWAFRKYGMKKDVETGAQPINEEDINVNEPDITTPQITQVIEESGVENLG